MGVKNKNPYGEKENPKKERILQMKKDLDKCFDVDQLKEFIEKYLM